MAIANQAAITIENARLFAEAERRASEMTALSRIATTLDLEQSVEECMAIMTDKRIRHLPVIDGGKLVGIISIGDLVKSIITDQKFIIEQLERYITS